MMDTFINSFDEVRLQALCDPRVIPHSAGVTLRWPGADLVLSAFSPEQINTLVDEFEVITGRLTEKAYRMGWDARRGGSVNGSWSGKGRRPERPRNNNKRPHIHRSARNRSIRQKTRQRRKSEPQSKPY